MNPRRLALALTVVLALSALPLCAQTIGINVVLNRAVTQPILADLGTHGTVRDVVKEINAVTMLAKASELPKIQALPYVLAANPDQERSTGPEETAAVDFAADGLSTWDLDAINVTNFGAGRTVTQTGAGVYVAILDTGLLNTWPYYFGTDHIATQYAKSFGGGGAMDVGAVSEQPNKWQLDQNSHGTHVTSTILGYNYGGTAINGMAPDASVIPVKVLNQNGNGWSSAIAEGIVYVTNLKLNELDGAPLVINMSLGGGRDAMEIAAIDYAIEKGVIVVAAAGNNGTRGMGYPGAYAPVISAAAAGWNHPDTLRWWRNEDVPDPTNAQDFYIISWSSRQKAGQELDVTAPGVSVVGPYQVNGQLSYYYLSGTSMASPHVAGLVALMLEKNPSLTASEAEGILKATALPLPTGCRTLIVGGTQECWDATNAAGAGLVQADAAVAGVDTPATFKTRKR